MLILLMYKTHYQKLLYAMSMILGIILLSLNYKEKVWSTFCRQKTTKTKKQKRKQKQKQKWFYSPLPTRNSDSLISLSLPSHSLSPAFLTPNLHRTHPITFIPPPPHSFPACHSPHSNHSPHPSHHICSFSLIAGDATTMHHTPLFPRARSTVGHHQHPQLHHFISGSSFFHFGSHHHSRSVIVESSRCATATLLIHSGSRCFPFVIMHLRRHYP